MINNQKSDNALLENKALYNELLKNKKLTIGGVSFDTPFVLAPLAGVTDAPFRRICFEMGASYAVSEMVSAKGLYYHDRHTAELLEILPGEGPVGFQIFGHEPEIIEYAAKALDGYSNKILDINMGCPVPKIVKNFEGSYLMKDPELVYDIVKAAVSGSSKPVTAKIRAGWDSESINAVEVAKAIEAAGGLAVFVHGRTKEQYYSGRADYSVIADVKKSVAIPVIGNGDVFGIDDAKRMFDETGVDGIMIGRGAQGNPWIFRELQGEDKPDLDEKKAVMIRHLDDVIALKGEYVAIREMRKHFSWYLKGEHGSARLRGEINQINSADELRRRILEL